MGPSKTLTCSKLTIETLEKGGKRYEICSKLTINTLERLCGDIIVNFEHILHLSSVAIVHYEHINVCRRIFFLYKYHYPKYIDKQMLYLTSFKIVADFLNNLNFLDISLQVHVQLIFPEKKICFPAILLKLIIL